MQQPLLDHSLTALSQPLPPTAYCGAGRVAYTQPLPPTAYCGAGRVAYTQPLRYGRLVIPVLHFLWGQPWDQLALNFVRAVAPRFISVTTERWLGGSRHRQVNVVVAADGRTIVRIEQDVTVGADGLKDACGYGVECALRERLPDGVFTIPAKPAQ